MKLNNENATVFFPDGNEELGRTTHLAISAHHDDIELMAMHGVLECFGKKDKWFTGVVVTDGAGSPRNGLYADYTDEEMKAVRVVEQEKAAFVGEYAAQIRDFLSELSLEAVYGQTMLKAMGIVLMTQFAAQVCRDMDAPSIACRAELCGRLMLLGVALPIFLKLTQMAVGALQ